MKKFDPFDGYTINVFFDDDGEYLAHFVELPNISAFGESPRIILYFKCRPVRLIHLLKLF